MKFFFFSSRRRHTRWPRDWSSDVCSSDLKGVVDVSSRGQSLGSVAVREAVLRLRPRLVVCGHIHGCAGQQALLGTTPVVNEIGRASCRERVEISVVDEDCEKMRGMTDV